MGRKKRTTVLCVQTYDMSECAENIVHYVDTERIWSGAVTVPDFVKMMHMQPGYTVVYVDDLKAFGESALAFISRTCKPPKFVEDRKEPLHRTKNGRYIFEKEDRYKLLGNSARWYELQLLYNNRTVVYRDWRNLIPVDIEDIRQDFWDDSEPNATEAMKDVISVANCWNAVNKVIDISTALTIGSVAISQFKKSLKGSYSSYFPQLDDDVLNFCRKAYHGGLVGFNESFITKHNPYNSRIIDHDTGTEVQKMSYIDPDSFGYAYDKNSMYMAKASEPISFGQPVRLDMEIVELMWAYLAFGYDTPIKDKFGISDVEDWCRRQGVFVQVTLDADVKPGHAPCLSLVLNGKVDAETACVSTGGEICAVLNTPAIIALARHYDVHSIKFHEGYKFRTSRDIFKKYKDYWADVKNKAQAEGNASMRLVAKLMMNNLIGKLATKPNHESVYMSEFEDRAFYKTIKTYKNTAPVFAAADITGWARLELADKIAENYEHAIRWDTDCIFFDCRCDSLFDIGGNVGQWKIEHKYRDLYVHGPKCYAMLNEDMSITIMASGANKDVKENAHKIIDDLAYTVVAGGAERVFRPSFDAVCAHMNTPAFNNIRGKSLYLHDEHGAHSIPAGLFSFHRGLISMTDEQIRQLTKQEECEEEDDEWEALDIQKELCYNLI